MRIPQQNEPHPIEMPEAPNPRLLRAIVKQHSTFSDHRPVDTYNTNIIDSDSLPEVPDPTHKQRTVSVDKKTGKKVSGREAGAKAVSFFLRSAFAALTEAHRESPLSQLSSITVNFDHA
ncbi:hypothetical protein WNY58_16320 [Neptuniibacter pectenicola]|uniref:Uncharacterized protein n=1 Tax=Neptuniibacter pectenicola TaxID=1806669 RepID=A0ABU9TW63_9GAMM